MEQSEDTIPQQHFHGALKLQGRSLSSLAHLVLAGIELTLATAYLQTERRKNSKARTPSPPLCGTNLQYEAHSKVQTSPSSPELKRLRKPQHKPIDPYSGKALAQIEAVTSK
jgi:hypothetical protein